MVCSSLRRLYRQILLFGRDYLTSCPGPAAPPTLPDVWFLFLYGSYDLIYSRLLARMGHFMSPDLLRSQFDVLEPPTEEENSLALDIRRSKADIAMEIKAHLLSVCS